MYDVCVCACVCIVCMERSYERSITQHNYFESKYVAYNEFLGKKLYNELDILLTKLRF